MFQQLLRLHKEDHPDQPALPCDLCHSLKKKCVDDPRLALEFTAEELLRKEGSKSCDICALIVQGVRRFENASWSLREDVSRIYMYALSNKGDSLTVEIYFRTDMPKLVLEFYHMDGSPPWDAIRRRSAVTGYPVLTKGVQWAKSNLEQCLGQHASCAIIKETLLPKRTLFFTRLSSGTIHVQLQEHENRKGRYIALSHCWGSQQACITTSKNLEAHKKSMPWDSLPATFQDAIVFTLELGLNHLWIDSLCILQQNAKDWEIESSRMGNIYQNAYLTLAATSASNGSEGCFSVQRKQAQEFRLRLRRRHGFVVVREKIQHWQKSSTQVFTKSFPLLTRGWVLQERYLSPRTLHFCLHELVWECIEDLSCECGGILVDCDPLGRLQLVTVTAMPLNPLTIFDKSSRSQALAKGKLSAAVQRMRRVPGSNHSLPVSEPLGDPHDPTRTKASYKKIFRKTLRKESKTLSKNGDDDSISFDSTPMQNDRRELSEGPQATEDTSPADEEASTEQRAAQYLEHISDEWHSIVEQYTSLKLSKETDRLPAVSGLAMLASSVLGTYSCGLWLKTIAKDLMWRVPMLEHGYGRPAEFTGPSWSWASVNGPVAYWNDLDDHAEDEDIQRLRHDARTLETWFERAEAKQALQQRLQQRAARRQKPPDLQATCDVNLSGENPFGEVSSGSLKIRGFIRDANLLRFSRYASAQSTHTDTHDLWKYHLGLRTEERWDYSLDVELPFFADYILSKNSDGVLDNPQITLFQLHQNVCLVLTGGPQEYRRIGIVRQPSAYQSLYDLDWMTGGSREAVITIV